MKTIASILIAVVVIVSLFWALPLWSVWRQELAGEAALRKAVQTKKILVEQARAEKESAALRAAAISIIGKAAKDFPEYRTQEFLGAFAEALKEGNIQQIMYIPTEGNIPITEANRFSKKE